MINRINKRANVPIIILVIGVLVVCGLVLASISISLGGYLENFDSMCALELLNSVVEKIKFYEKENINDFDKNSLQEGSTTDSTLPFLTYIKDIQKNGDEYFIEIVSAKEDEELFSVKYKFKP